MFTARSIVIVATSLFMFGSTSDRTRLLGDEKKEWALSNVKTMPAKIELISATTFRCGGVPCKLLGVKDSADPAVRKQAEAFTRAWFKSVGNYIGVYNDNSPLVTKDGVAVVWIRGYDTYLSCLSEELVRAGLVEIDESSWKDYTFTVPVKSGPDPLEKWQSKLREAKDGHARGEKLKLLFDWPPK